MELRDYRELEGERFDKIVSVGMFEHVGRARFAEYFRAAHERLNPGGLFLNHAIAERSAAARALRATFLEHFIFPDGELVAIVGCAASSPSMPDSKCATSRVCASIT